VRPEVRRRRRPDPVCPCLRFVQTVARGLAKIQGKGRGVAAIGKAFVQQTGPILAAWGCVRNTRNGLERGFGMTKVIALRLRDRVQQDSEAIAALYRNLGSPLAEGLVARALGELALAMAGLAEQVRQHDLDKVAQQFRHLQHRAQSLGLKSLAQVAGDARHCVTAGDSTAFAAVWARLLRIAEASLVADVDAADRVN
jgi:hypothetical protein